jgi:hypothetical protein
MLEYKEVPELDVLDWQNLYFKVNTLFKKCYRLRNRWRFINLLEGTKKLFLQYLADETTISH